MGISIPSRSAVLELIDQICDRYEAAWLAGQRPRIDDYLHGLPENECSALLRELLRLERVYLQRNQRQRWQRGERVLVQAYLEEAPSLRAHLDLVFELVCGEVLLREEFGERPRPADYLALVPTHQTQLRHFFAARHLLPSGTLGGLSDRVMLRAMQPPTVADPNQTVDQPLPLSELPLTQQAPKQPASDGGTVTAPPGYEVLDKLGQGGMGIVYKARQINADRLVALKMILAGGHADADQLTRFRTEAEAIARLQHPHVVQVFEVGTHNGLPFFSLEFCAGGSLDKKLAGTPLPPRETATLVAKLAQGVQAAHEAKVLHRDLKPGNVLLAADGTPKVTDFGLAKKLDAQGVTITGVIMGTPSYMAPEQARGASQELGPAVDVYALGAILYECLTGRPPFRAATTWDTLHQVLTREPVPPRQLNVQVPRDLETVCLKCLHKEAIKRYASAPELADELGRFLRGEPIVARPVGRLERGVKWARREPRVAGMLAAVLGVLAVGVTVSTMLAVKATQNEQKVLEHKYRAEMILVQREYEAGNLEHIRELLEAQIPRGWNATDFRGFEWYFWERLSRPNMKPDYNIDDFERIPDVLRRPGSWPLDRQDSISGHTAVVSCVSFSPDGRRLASGSWDQTVCVWRTPPEVSLPPGDQVQLTLRGHTASVRSVSYSPDGRLLASAGGDKTVRVWDAASGQELLTLKGHTA
jgi:hypothetical protein